MLERQNIFGETESKVEKSLDRIKFAYEQAQFRGLGALYVCYSGGKDSTVLAALCKMAKERWGVEYELHYNVTGIDPPELIQFMRANFRLVCGDRVWGNLDGETLHWEMYEKSMWKLIEEKHMPPTRLARYCCKELKEGGGEGRMCLTGVRWAESTKRAGRRPFEIMTSKSKDKMLFNDNDEGRQAFETCIIKKKMLCNPIVEWDEDDVWDFIHGNNIPYCKLYDCGRTRLGCIGCPLSGHKGQKRDFRQYPKYKDMYYRAFDKMLKQMPNKEMVRWKSAEDVMDWWLVEEFDKPIDGQMSIWDGNE